MVASKPVGHRDGHASTRIRTAKFRRSSPQNPVYGQAVRKATETTIKPAAWPPFSTVYKGMLHDGTLCTAYRLPRLSSMFFRVERIALFADFMLPLAPENPAWARYRPQGKLSCAAGMADGAEGEAE
ncbi:hypothetical protein AT5A_00985 [Agrobacterium tumefaciens 5A]|nr:hypothetical protein AT5A_00985 [Agrobacterium tumefaciens 5A]NIB55931.1 hypothetical protein [Agrobacterium tumefaciens]NSZ23468.1 hypothetical protein [Agrobacterium tumefaciens]NTB19553.1 hypothetical protein [Agrobacterium tumefaciens]